MSLLTKRKVILCDIESTYNTPVTPDPATDAICVENIALKPVDTLFPENEAQKGEFGETPSEYAGGLWEVTFDVRLAGSGSLGVPPEISKLWRICGLQETINAGTNVQYALSSAIGDSGTIELFEDGRKTVLSGCRGTFTWEMTVGGHIVFSFTIKGHESARVNEATPAVTYIDQNPIVFVGQNVVLGIVPLKVQTVSGDLGNELTSEPISGEADGYGEILITDRKVTGSIDPDDDLTRDDIARWKAGTTDPISIIGVGKTAGNKVSIQFADTFYKEVDPGDRSGVMINQIGFGCAAGDGSLSFVMI